MEKQQRIEIGQRLRQRRQELGLTREKMSELADIGTGYYGQLEVGTSQMSIDTLIKLSRSMHLPMEYILFGKGYRPAIRLGKAVLLGRGISPGPQQPGVLFLPILGFPGGIEIDQADVSARIQKNMLRLDIPMENPMFVEKLQCPAQLQKRPGQCPLGEGGLSQGDTLDVFLCHTGFPVCLNHGQDAGQVGVA